MILGGVLGIALLAMGFFIGKGSNETIYVGYPIETLKVVRQVEQLPPEVIYITQKEVVTKTITEYIETEPEYREFESLGEFMEWRGDNLVMEIQGKLYRLPHDQYSEVMDCDDVAEAWQREALADGYLVSQQIIEYGKLLGERVSETKKKHDGILTMIGNDIYYLDTYPPYSITRVASRD